MQRLHEVRGAVQPLLPCWNVGHDLIAVTTSSQGCMLSANRSSPATFSCPRMLHADTAHTLLLRVVQVQLRFIVACGLVCPCHPKQLEQRSSHQYQQGCESFLLACTSHQLSRNLPPALLSTSGHLHGFAISSRRRPCKAICRKSCLLGPQASSSHWQPPWTFSSHCRRW